MYQSRYGVLVSQQRKTDAERPAQPEHVDIRTESGVLLLQILVNHYDSKDQILDAIALATSDVEKGKNVEYGFRLLDGFSGTTGKDGTTGEDTASGDSDWDCMSDGSATENTTADEEWNLL